ncbi:MAG TPA: GrpB family protein [Thermoplasmata archaeon]|nr:GrpB family protein [Thermoplasmata archaeon]
MAPEEPVVIVRYDPAWSDVFQKLGSELRTLLGPVARRIDHVGSTAVPGLDAKPVIDVQVSVDSLQPERPYLQPLTAGGYRWNSDNPDRSKRFFREPEGAPRAHLHVRAVGSFDEQLNLLFRDYLRTHSDSAAEYARTKWTLAERFRTDREGYVRAKEPTVWELLRRAHDWAQETGWSAGPTDL